MTGGCSRQQTGETLPADRAAGVPAPAGVSRQRAGAGPRAGPVRTYDGELGQPDQRAAAGSAARPRLLLRRPPRPPAGRSDGRWPTTAAVPAPRRRPARTEPERRLPAPSHLAAGERRWAPVLRQMGQRGRQGHRPNRTRRATGPRPSPIRPSRRVRQQVKPRDRSTQAVPNPPASARACSPRPVPAREPAGQVRRPCP